MRHLVRSAVGLVAVCLAVGGLAASQPVHASDPMHEHEHEMGNFELFLSLQGLSYDGPNPKPERQEDSWGAADIVFSANRGRWRMMGEYNLGPIEKDLERFQVGFEPVPDTLFWLGRFHQPGSAWNNEVHHGHYLQTTITRPSIEFWEDEKGLIPQHLVGALLESRRPLGSVAGVQVSLGLGFGSVLQDEGLVTVGLLNRDRGGHQLSETARLSFLPQYLGSSSIGLLIGHHRMPVIDRALSVSLDARWVEQSNFGAYFDLDRKAWRALGAVYYLDVGLQPAELPGTTAERREHVAAGYVQLERQFSHHFTAFARHENSANALASRYVAIHADDFVARGNILGMRWDFARRQALTVQLSRLATLRGRQSVARIQWSGVVP